MTPSTKAEKQRRTACYFREKRSSLCVPAAFSRSFLDRYGETSGLGTIPRPETSEPDKRSVGPENRYFIATANRNAMKNVIGMGNALTDILISLENDEIIDAFDLKRGGMHLVDTDLQHRIAARASALPRTLSLGGSASNTIRAMARLGTQVGYIGKVGRDETGDFFERAMKEQGIDPHIFRSGRPSGRCISLVSADGERTMCTALGAALEMTRDEIDPRIFDGYDCLYIEGYLVQNHELISHAVRTAKSLGLKVALDLASFNVVEENLDFLRDLAKECVDILFANEQEAQAFTGEPDPLEALDRIARCCELAVVKVGIRGAYVRHEGRTEHVGILTEARRTDTTGAGDFYAAGFLSGLCKGLTMRQCGTIGAIAAGKVIEVIGTTFPECTWQEIDRLVAETERGELLL